MVEHTEKVLENVNYTLLSAFLVIACISYSEPSAVAVRYERAACLPERGITKRSGIKDISLNVSISLARAHSF